MKRLNWRIVLSNIVEAREQLEEIEARAKCGKKISEIELQILLEHAYHHLNFAWNVRRVPTKNYRNVKDEEFDLWSRFPKEIGAYKIGRKKKAKQKDVDRPKVITKQRRCIKQTGLT